MSSTQTFLRVLSVICVLISLFFVGFGIFTTYTYGHGDEYTGTYYGDKTGHIVGGDAYNYIIIACRGIGLISVGIVFSVIGCIFAVLSQPQAILKKKNQTKNQKQAMATKRESLEEEEKFTCPECGVDIQREEKICPGCGVEIEWTEIKEN